jgi:hypothetical protein
MSTTTEDEQETMLLDQLTERYCASLAPPTPMEVERDLNLFLARLDSTTTRRSHLIRWSLVGASVALVAVALVQGGSMLGHRSSGPEAPPLSYQLDGGSVVEGGYLRESGSAGMKVQFNEGSECAFTPGTRGQIRSVDKTGARLGIEHGTASFKITRSASRRWLVEAGPFEVAVTGTVFTVSWDPIGEQFELKLRHGSVLVRGPVSAGEIALRTGQRLVVNLARAESVISEMPVGTGESEALAPTVSPPEIPAVAEKPAGPTPAPSIAKPGIDRRWSDQLARGHWDRILAEANRMGIENALAKTSSEDLFALADAARYRRNPDLARAALLAERRRFPNSARTLDAIFLLGRAEELHEHGAAQAIARYDEYLTRAPAGPFVGEALGRKMTLTDRLEGPASARPVAEEYLRRFPKGNYAGAARTLLRAP